MKSSEDPVVWDLSDLYKGAEDPAIEADKTWCTQEADRFERDYAGRVALLSPEELGHAVSFLETLKERSEKIASFAYLSFVTRTQDARAAAFWQAAQEFQSLITRKTLFFELEWSVMDDSVNRVDDRVPAHYRHHLQKVRAYGPHRLSGPEEQVMENLSLSGQKAWVNLFDKLMGSMRFGPDGRTLARVLSDLYHPDRERRRDSALEVTAGLKEVLPIAAHIHNALSLDKALRDNMRSFPHWLRNMNLVNELDDRQVELLVGAVTSRYDIVQEYYALKGKLLGVSELRDYDRYAPLPGLPARKFTWEEARGMVLAALESFSPEAARVASLFFDRKWIHAASVTGKPGGAFSHPTVPSCHPFISLNFTGTQRDVMTLAHELGHGIHQFLSRDQGFFNNRVPLIMAETASVFSEMLAFEILLQEAGTPETGLAMLCAKLEDLFSTTFRQIAMNRFEEAAHNERRRGGELSPERFSSLWMSTQQEMFGESLVLGEHYRLWWSYIPHFIHTPGYVYAYSFAELTALTLYRQYRAKSSAFVPLYLDLLRSGSKVSPRDLLAPFGLDPSHPSFYEGGILILEEMVQEALLRSREIEG